MVKAEHERAVLQKAAAAGYLSDSEVELSPPPSLAPQQPVFSLRLDHWIQLGRLSADQVRALLQELQLEGIADTQAGGSAAASAAANREVALGATLDEKSDEAKAILAVATDSFVLNQTVNGAAEGLPAPISSTSLRFPVEHWDRYEFLSLLGQGGMGAVYKARDLRLSRIVALKFIRSGDPQMTARFLQEARTQSRVDHPGICKVFDVGEIDGKAYIVMQFVDGQPLHQAVKQMTLLEKVQVIKDTAEALHVAHELGIIHRDVKPANIMLERFTDAEGVIRNRPVVMDFGLAREATDGKGLTESGAIIGTPSYMSPEQARGEVRRLDRRTDVYSLGATLYDILTGTPPFEDESVVNIILKVLNEDIKPLRQKLPELPEALDVIVNKCLNKEAAQRYQTAQALADDLGRFLSNQRIVARQVSLFYRIQYRARRNKPVAVLIVALFLGFCGFTAYGTRTYLQSLRKEREAKERAELAQKLGQTVKDMEWLSHASYVMPLHDTTPEKDLLHARMTDVKKELEARGRLAVGLGPYVLGRGHMALHEWNLAYAALQQAEAQGFSGLELDYALGRVLGELYSQGLAEARRSGDKSFVEKRKAELRTQFLVPAIEGLHRSRSLSSVPTLYVQALLDFYEEHYDAALLNAQFSQQEQPWLYEAKQLEGDVFAARARDEKDHGDSDQAERLYLEAIRRYEQAAESGHSDYTIYESIAESFIRLEEMDMFRGRDPRPKLERALLAADQSLEAAPKDSYGFTKQAAAYYFVATFLRNQQKTDDLKSVIAQIRKAGNSAISVHPDDPYVYDIFGNSYLKLATSAQLPLESQKSYFEEAKKYFNMALRLNPRFVWAYNDLATAHSQTAHLGILPPQQIEAELLAAIQALSTAAAIDPGYSYAFNNLSAVYQEMALLVEEHGKDPTKYVEKAIQAARERLRMQKLSPSAFGNMSEAYLWEAIWKIDKSQVAISDLELAERNIHQLISMNPNIALAYSIDAHIHYLMARWTNQTHEIRRLSIQAGYAAVKHCLSLDRQDPECQIYLGLLLTADAMDKDPSDSLSLHKQAAQLATQSLSQAGHQSDDVVMNAASVFYEIVEYKLAHHLPAVSEIQQGSAILKQLVTMTQNSPRSLAMLAGLLVFDSRGQQDRAQRAASLSQAQTYFNQAFQENPLLRNRYGQLAAEAASRLVSP